MGSSRSWSACRHSGRSSSAAAALLLPPPPPSLPLLSSSLPALLGASAAPGPRCNRPGLLLWLVPRGERGDVSSHAANPSNCCSSALGAGSSPRCSRSRSWGGVMGAAGRQPDCMAGMLLASNPKPSLLSRACLLSTLGMKVGWWGAGWHSK